MDPPARPCDGSTDVANRR